MGLSNPPQSGLIQPLSEDQCLGNTVAYGFIQEDNTQVLLDLQSNELMHTTQKNSSTASESVVQIEEQTCLSPSQCLPDTDANRISQLHMIHSDDADSAQLARDFSPDDNSERAFKMTVDFR